MTTWQIAAVPLTVFSAGWIIDVLFVTSAPIAFSVAILAGPIVALKVARRAGYQFCNSGSVDD